MTSTLFNVTVDDQQRTEDGKSAVITYQNSWEDSGFDALGIGNGDRRLQGFEGSFNGTWKRSVYNRSDAAQTEPPYASLRFRGVAVYVSCILTDVDKFGNPANSDMVFKLDSVQKGSFREPALGRKPAQIRTVFQLEGLPPGPHEIEIQNGANGNGPFAYNVILLDAITYTDVDPSIENTTGRPPYDAISVNAVSASMSIASNNIPTTSVTSPSTTASSATSPTTMKVANQASPPASLSPGRHNNVVAIAAGVCGGVAGLVCILLAFLAWRRRQRGPSIAFDRLRFVRWRSQRKTDEVATTVKYYSSDMESLGSRSSNSSVESLYTMPTPETLGNDSDRQDAYRYNRRYA